MFIQTLATAGTAQKWEMAGRIGYFGNFFNGLAKSPCVQFVLQNCEILHSVWGLYDKNSASYYCFTSDVMYEWYKRLVYTHPNLLTGFCQTRNLAWFFLPGLINLQWSRAIVALKCDWRWLIASFWVYIWGYQLDVRFGSLMGCLQIIFF